MQEEQLAAKSTSKGDETTPEADSSGAVEPTRSHGQGATCIYSQSQFGGTSTSATGHCTCGSCSSSSSQAYPGEQQQQQSSTGGDNEDQQAPPTISPGTVVQHPQRASFDTENPFLHDFCSDPLVPISWPEASPSGPLADQFRNIGLQSVPWSSDNNPFDASRTFAANETLPPTSHASNDPRRDNIGEAFTNTVLDNADSGNLTYISQAQRRVQSLPTTQAEMDHFLLQCRNGEFLTPSAQPNMQNNRVDHQRRQGAASVTNSDAVELQRLRNFARFARSPAFQEFEAAAQAYCVDLSSTQTTSRSHSMPSLLFSLRYAWQEWNNRERQGHEADVIRGADELLAREVDLYTTSRNLDIVTSHDGINTASDAHRRQFQDEVSLLHAGSTVPLFSYPRAFTNGTTSIATKLMESRDGHLLGE
jgi:hypothetical protein